MDPAAKGQVEAMRTGLWSSIIDMKKLVFSFWMLVFALAVPHLQAQPVRVEAVEVELISRADIVKPGTSIWLGLRFKHDPHWHSYWRNPGDSGLPTSIQLKLPDGWRDHGIVWPTPERIFVGPLASYAFEGDLLLPFRVDIPASAKAGPIRITGRAQWLMCREVCIPGEADVAVSLIVGSEERATVHAGLFERATANSPGRQIRVNAHLADGRVSFALEAAPDQGIPSGSKLAEFFPYVEGWLQGAAPQAFLRLGGPTSDARRLELRLVEGVGREELLKAGFNGGPLGVLRLDGQLFEVQAMLTDSPITGGHLLSTAIGAPDDRAAGAANGQAGGGLAGLLGRSGALPGSGGLGQTGALSGMASGETARQEAVRPKAAESAASSGKGPGSVSGSLLAAAGFALIGGLILNLMPCVFPVIGLKVLGFANHGSGSSAARRGARHGALAFTAGVFVSFWSLAGLLIGLRAAGEAAGWGFQLQSPLFVAAMALLFVLIALNFAGVFEIGLSLTRLGQADPLASGAGGPLASFGSGVLAVLVATPCTAPFMGSALGYTLGQPAPEVMFVFSALALGMALPYLALGYFPGALAWLPRPGRWMESFRQFLAFPMFATAAWLGWVFALQVGVDGLLALSIGAVLIALAAWLYGRFVQSATSRYRGLAAVLAVCALLGGLWVAWPAQQPVRAGTTSSLNTTDLPASAGKVDSWETWSRARVQEAVAQGRPVFVDFTAAWCVSCQANKLLVLGRDPVDARMRELNVLRLRADWTTRDSVITAELERHGRTGVPLYLLYVPGDSSPRVLPELLTSGLVLEALQALR